MNLDTHAAFHAANRRRLALIERERTKPLSIAERAELADLTTAVDAYMARVYPRPRVWVEVGVGTPFARVLLGARATVAWSHALRHGDGAEPSVDGRPGRDAFIYQSTEPTR